MNKNDFKFLEFRDEFIKLLHKYNYNITGLQEYPSSMDVFDAVNDEMYSLSDLSDGYLATKNNGLDNIDLVKEYIMSSFSDDKQDLFGSNIKNIGIFTSDIFKAKCQFQAIYNKNKDNIQSYVTSKNSTRLVLNDGTQYILCKASENSRGIKCNGAYIDSCLTLEELNYIIFPMLGYCKKENITVI